MWPRTPIAGASRKPCSPNGERIDALVNCAGTTKFVAHTDLEGLSADDILGIFRVNLVGPYQMIRACAALKDARGCIVNVSSVASILGTGSSIAYAASKRRSTPQAFRSRARSARDPREHRRAGYVKTPGESPRTAPTARASSSGASPSARR